MQIANYCIKKSTGKSGKSADYLFVGTCLIEWSIQNGLELPIDELRTLAKLHCDLWLSRGVSSEKYSLKRSSYLYQTVLQSPSYQFIAEVWLEYLFVLQYMGENHAAINILNMLLSGGSIPPSSLLGKGGAGAVSTTSPFEDDSSGSSSSPSINLDSVDISSMLLYLGLALKACGRFDEANAALFQAVKCGPPPSFSRLELMFIISRNLEQSENSTEEAYRMVHSHIATEFNLSSSFDFGDWLNNFNTWSSLGDKCVVLSFFSLAADLYGQGLVRSSSSYEKSMLWFKFAKACFRSGRTGDAQLAIKQALTLQPHNVQMVRALEAWSKTSSEFESLSTGSLSELLERMPMAPDPLFQAVAKLQAIHRSISIRKELAYGVMGRSNAGSKMSVRIGCLLGGVRPVFLSARSDWMGRVRTIRMFDLENGTSLTIKVRPPFIPPKEEGVPKLFKLEMKHSFQPRAIPGSGSRIGSFDGCPSPSPSPSSFIDLHLDAQSVQTSLEPSQDEPNQEMEDILTLTFVEQSPVTSSSLNSHRSQEGKSLSSISANLLLPHWEHALCGAEPLIGVEASLDMPNYKDQSPPYLPDEHYIPHSPDPNHHLFAHYLGPVVTDRFTMCVASGEHQVGSDCFHFRLESEGQLTHIDLLHAKSCRQMQFSVPREHIDRSQDTRRILDTLLSIARAHPVLSHFASPPPASIRNPTQSASLSHSSPTKSPQRSVKDSAAYQDQDLASLIGATQTVDCVLRDNLFEIAVMIEEPEMENSGGQIVPMAHHILFVAHVSIQYKEPYSSPVPSSSNSLVSSISSPITPFSPTSRASTTFTRPPPHSSQSIHKTVLVPNSLLVLYHSHHPPSSAPSSSSSSSSSESLSVSQSLLPSPNPDLPFLIEEIEGQRDQLELEMEIEDMEMRGDQQALGEGEGKGEGGLMLLSEGSLISQLTQEELEIEVEEGDAEGIVGEEQKNIHDTAENPVSTEEEVREEGEVNSCDEVKALGGLVVRLVAETSVKLALNEALLGRFMRLESEMEKKDEEKDEEKEMEVQVQAGGPRELINDYHPEMNQEESTSNEEDKEEEKDHPDREGEKEREGEEKEASDSLDLSSEQSIELDPNLDRGQEQCILTQPTEEEMKKEEIKKEENKKEKEKEEEEKKGSTVEGEKAMEEEKKQVEEEEQEDRKDRENEQQVGMMMGKEKEEKAEEIEPVVVELPLEEKEMKGVTEEEEDEEQLKRECVSSFLSLLISEIVISSRRRAKLDLTPVDVEEREEEKIIEKKGERLEQVELTKEEDDDTFSGEKVKEINREVIESTEQAPPPLLDINQPSSSSSPDLLLVEIRSLASSLSSSLLQSALQTFIPRVVLSATPPMNLPVLPPPSPPLPLSPSEKQEKEEKEEKENNKEGKGEVEKTEEKEEKEGEEVEKEIEKKEEDDHRVQLEQASPSIPPEGLTLDLKEKEKEKKEDSGEEDTLLSELSDEQVEASVDEERMIGDSSKEKGLEEDEREESDQPDLEPPTISIPIPEQEEEEEPQDVNSEEERVERQRLEKQARDEARYSDQMIPEHLLTLPRLISLVEEISEQCTLRAEEGVRAVVPSQVSLSSHLLDQLNQQMSDFLDNEERDVEGGEAKEKGKEKDNRKNKEKENGSLLVAANEREEEVDVQQRISPLRDESEASSPPLHLSPPIFASRPSLSLYPSYSEEKEKEKEKEKERESDIDRTPSFSPPTSTHPSLSSPILPPSSSSSSSSLEADRAVQIPPPRDKKKEKDEKTVVKRKSVSLRSQPSPSLSPSPSSSVQSKHSGKDKEKEKEKLKEKEMEKGKEKEKEKLSRDSVSLSSISSSPFPSSLSPSPAPFIPPIPAPTPPPPSLPVPTHNSSDSLSHSHSLPHSRNASLSLPSSESGVTPRRPSVIDTHLYTHEHAYNYTHHLPIFDHEHGQTSSRSLSSLTPGSDYPSSALSHSYSSRDSSEPTQRPTPGTGLGEDQLGGEVTPSPSTLTTNTHPGHLKWEAELGKEKEKEKEREKETAKKPKTLVNKGKALSYLTEMSTVLNQPAPLPRISPSKSPSPSIRASLSHLQSAPTPTFGYIDLSKLALNPPHPSHLAAQEKLIENYHLEQLGLLPPSTSLGALKLPSKKGKGRKGSPKEGEGPRLMMSQSMPLPPPQPLTLPLSSSPSAFEIPSQAFASPATLVRTLRAINEHLQTQSDPSRSLLMAESFPLGNNTLDSTTATVSSTISTGNLNASQSLRATGPLNANLTSSYFDDVPIKDWNLPKTKKKTRSELEEPLNCNPTAFLKPEAGVQNLSYEESLVDFRRNGYVSGGVCAFSAMWEKKLLNCLRTVHSASSLKLSLKKLRRDAQVQISLQEAFCALADTDCNVLEALGRVMQRDFLREIRLVCSMLDIDEILGLLPGGRATVRPDLAVRKSYSTPSSSSVSASETIQNLRAPSGHKSGGGKGKRSSAIHMALKQSRQHGEDEVDQVVEESIVPSSIFPDPPPLEEEEDEDDLSENNSDRSSPLPLNLPPRSTLVSRGDGSSSSRLGATPPSAIITSARQEILSQQSTHLNLSPTSRSVRSRGSIIMRRPSPGSEGGTGSFLFPLQDGSLGEAALAAAQLASFSSIAVGSSSPSTSSSRPTSNALGSTPLTSTPSSSQSVTSDSAASSSSHPSLVHTLSLPKKEQFSVRVDQAVDQISKQVQDAGGSFIVLSRKDALRAKEEERREKYRKVIEFANNEEQRQLYNNKQKSQQLHSS